MKTLLRVDSSLRLKNSYSRRAGDRFVQEWKILNPNGKVINREVGTRLIPHLDQTLFEEFHAVKHSSERLRLSDELIAELVGCDEILMTVPMYNFGIPSSLKAYFDLVVRTGKTFRYEDKPIGLLKNKRSYILSTMGDVKAEALSLMEMHLQQVLNYIGITDIMFYSLDGTAREDCVKQHLNNQNASFYNMLTDHMEQVKRAIATFVKAGDDRDTAVLERILHPDFQNIQDGFFEEDGIFVFSKADYIGLIRTKRFGGSPRNIDCRSIEQTGNIAVVQVKLESKDLIFYSSIMCVHNKGHWQIINNTPTINVK